MHLKCRLMQAEMLHDGCCMACMCSQQSNRMAHEYDSRIEAKAIRRARENLRMLWVLQTLQSTEVLAARRAVGALEEQLSDARDRVRGLKCECAALEGAVQVLSAAQPLSDHQACV